tara:strand:+ start:275 stop:592 length:318 start_codon:yes stop_codon:yes gene_type:complete
MYKRIRKLKNKCGDTRLLKLLNEGNIISMSCDECDIILGTKKENKELYINSVQFSCGPTVAIGSYITLSDFGKVKILGIYPSLSHNNNEYLFEILKTQNGKKERR